MQDMTDKKEKREILSGAIKKVKMYSAGKKETYPETEISKPKEQHVYYPDLYLNIEQAPQLEGYEAGDKVKLLIECDVVSHSMNERKNKKDENFNLQIKKIGCIKTNKNSY